MKLNEFKAWFEGYTESMEGAPSKKQWERIKEQVGAIDGVAVTQTVYLNWYRHRYFPQGPYWSALGVGSCSSSVGGQAQNAVDYMAVVNSAGHNGDGGTVFDGVTAMYAAGKAEASVN